MASPMRWRAAWIEASVSVCMFFPCLQDISAKEKPPAADAGGGLFWIKKINRSGVRPTQHGENNSHRNAHTHGGGDDCAL
jgi:hypothetical protein